MLETKSKWGKAFADKGLLLAPSIAQMYTTGEIAANICLETPGLDTLDILVLWKGFPTYASMQTIFTILKADHYYLEQNQYKQWEPDHDHLRCRFRDNIPPGSRCPGVGRRTRCGSRTTPGSPMSRSPAESSTGR